MVDKRPLYPLFSSLKTQQWLKDGELLYGSQYVLWRRPIPIPYCYSTQKGAWSDKEIVADARTRLDGLNVWLGCVKKEYIEEMVWLDNHVTY